MSKELIKKTIVAFIFVLVLVMSFLIYDRINKNNYSNRVIIVKNIIKEKYDEIVYLGDNYIYTYNKGRNYYYSVFDLNGNRLYSFNSDKLLDIVSLSKKYFITKDDNYHLYSDNFEKIIDGEKITKISDYLINVDGNIINPNNEVLFSNIKNIKSYYHKEYFLIDNYFVDKKGNILLNDYEIVEEKIKDNDIDYFIIKKDNKYYCFFPLINKIIGDEFEKYYKYKDEIYVVSNNKFYQIVKAGLRKEIDFKISKDLKKKYNIKLTNAVSLYKILVIKDNYLGLLETNKNKFTKIIKTDNFSFKIIDNNYINIKVDNKNHIYDLNIKKIIYSSNNIDDIIMFNNGYKTIKRNNLYFLYDNNDILLLNNEKQIIPINSEVRFGNINKDIVIYDKNNYYDGKYINIDNNYYYKYEKNNKYYIISRDLKTKYESNDYLENIDEYIISLDNKKLVFNNIRNNKKNIYDIKNNKIINDKINKKEIILSNNKKITILYKNGEVIKEIKNRKLDNIYYNNLEGNIIIIEKSIFKNKKGVFIAE